MKPLPTRVRSSVLRLLIFSLVAAGLVLWFLWMPKNSHIGWTGASTRRPVQQRAVVAPTVAANKTADPFALVKGVDYFADYDIFNISLPPAGEDYDDGQHPTWKLRYMNQSTSKYPFRWISAKPRIAFVPNFLSMDECDALVATASPRMERSRVVPYLNSGGQQVQDVRTSSQTWLDVNSGIGKTVADRLMDMVGFAHGSSEMMQILRYELNQKYDAHNDYFDPKLYGPQSTNRAVTAFLYLSTVEEGGHTWFPDADGKTHEAWDFKSCKRGLGYKPTKGNVVIFYDMKPDGTLDPLSLHGGCPVKKGVKWGGTLWLRVPT